MKFFIQIMLFIGWNLSGMAQITFNGCHPLFEDQDYVFNLVDTDHTGRNVYTTTPVDGAQDCGGVGTCEFMIIWNDNQAKWEFIADDGNGDFSSPYVIYSNVSPSKPNPPSLLLGTWVENGTITNGECDGALSTNNAILAGDVQDMELDVHSQLVENRIHIYPLPASQIIRIQTTLPIKSLVVYDLKGVRVKYKQVDLRQIDVSDLNAGVYLLEVEGHQAKRIKKITIR